MDNNNGADVQAGGGVVAQEMSKRVVPGPESVKGGKTAVIIVACVVVLFLTVVVGVVGSMAINHAIGASYDIYYTQTIPVHELGMAVEMLQRQRTAMGEIIIGVATGELSLVTDAFNRSLHYRMVMFDSLDSYYVTIRDPEELRIFAEARMLYEVDFMLCFDRVYSLAMEGADPGYIYDVLREYVPAINVIIDNLGWCMDLRLGIAAEALHVAEDTAFTMQMVIIVIMVLAILGSCFAIIRAAVR